MVDPVETAELFAFARIVEAKSLSGTSAASQSRARVNRAGRRRADACDRPCRRRPVSRASGQNPWLRSSEETVVEAAVHLEVTEQENARPFFQLGVRVEDAPGMHGERPDLFVVKPGGPHRGRPADAGPHA